MPEFATETKSASRVLQPKEQMDIAFSAPNPGIITMIAARRVACWTRRAAVGRSFVQARSCRLQRGRTKDNTIIEFPNDINSSSILFSLENANNAHPSGFLRFVMKFEETGKEILGTFDSQLSATQLTLDLGLEARDGQISYRTSGVRAQFDFEMNVLSIIPDFVLNALFNFRDRLREAVEKKAKEAFQAEATRKALSDTVMTFIQPALGAKRARGFGEGEKQCSESEVLPRLIRGAASTRRRPISAQSPTFGRRLCPGCEARERLPLCRARSPRPISVREWFSRRFLNPYARSGIRRGTRSLDRLGVCNVLAELPVRRARP